jgi:hypothetical protein
VALYQASFPEQSTPSAARVRDFRWVRSDEFGRYRFPDADQQTMDLLLGIK